MTDMRDINIMVKPGSLKTSIEPFGDNRFLIRTTLTSHDQINLEIPKILSTKMGLPPQRFQLVNGIDENIKNYRIV